MSKATAPNTTPPRCAIPRVAADRLDPRHGFVAGVTLVLLACTIVCCPIRRADAVQVMVQNGQIQIQENALVSWVFNNQSSIEQARKELDEIIQTRLDLIVSACELAPEQRTKLELAAAGDIHRFFNEFESLRRSMPVGTVSQQEYQELWESVQPLRQKFNSGLHSRDSLFVRSISYVLDAKQQSRYAEFERLRRARQFESLVKGTIAMVENEIPLTNDQREKLLKLILSHDPPPRLDAVSYYQIYLVLYQVSKIPEDQLKPIFLKNEWTAMQRVLANGRAYEQMLRREGLLED